VAVCQRLNTLFGRGQAIFSPMMEFALTTASSVSAPSDVVATNSAKPVEKRARVLRAGGKHQALLAASVEDDVWPRPYVIEGGLRRVAPYHYTYNTWCKSRWRSRALLEIFESEFRDRPVAYYKEAMEAGKILINGKPASPDYIVKNGDLVSHKIHRHEPPVTAEDVTVIHEDEKMIVINKPSGIPVHPAGRYNFNSVIEMMKEKRGRDWIAYPCNRLDRLTSGIMFIAKDSRSAEELRAQIAGRSVRKEYIARVIGEFPDGEVVCDQPILSISPKLGLNRVRADGKEARTVFKKLAYYPPAQEAGQVSDVGRTKTSGEFNKDQDTPRADVEGYSVVRCLPVTGRTHQIRVHLQHLGYPIQNDPIYANRKVWGINLGRDDAEATENTDEDIITRLNRMGKEEVADAVAYYDEMVDKYHQKKAEKMSGEFCEVCDTPLYTDPGEHELCLYLHSLRYEDAGGAWSYKSALPQWAFPPTGRSGPTAVGSLDALVEAVKATDP
jgi:tRNA pseudouridine32 synthase